MQRSRSVMQSALQQIACTAPTLLEAGARHRSPPGAVPSHIIRLEQAARFCDTANRRSAAAPPEIIALSIAMREIITKKHPDDNPASTATAPTRTCIRPGARAYVPRKINLRDLPRVSKKQLHFTPPCPWRDGRKPARGSVSNGGGTVEFRG